MAKTKRNSSAIGKPSASGQGAKRQKITKAIEDPKIASLTPKEYYKEVYAAVENFDDEELSKLLSVKSVKIRYGQFDYMKMYDVLVAPTDENYANKNAELIRCLNALRADPRFWTMSVITLSKVMMDRRQHLDILRVLLRHENVRFRKQIHHYSFGHSIWHGNDRTMEFLMHVKWLNINYPSEDRGWTGVRAVHIAVGEENMMNSAGMLSVLLSHPRLLPDLHLHPARRGDLPRTALSHADKTYAENDDVLKKKRAAHHVRLLLGDDRVDMHLIKESGVDVGYAQIGHGGVA